MLCQAGVKKAPRFLAVGAFLVWLCRVQAFIACARLGWKNQNAADPANEEKRAVFYNRAAA